MRAAWLLLLLAGCELPAKRQPQQEAPHEPSSGVGDTTHQLFDVTVREYGSNEPLYGVIVELVQDQPCVHSHDDPCAPGPRRSARTNDDGLAQFVLPPLEDWRVERIAEAGYLTECPGLQDDDWHHRLVIKHTGTDRSDYTCMLVPASALKVHDRATAIRLAKADAETAAWLHNTRGVQVGSVERHGIRWEVWFATPDRGPSKMDPRTGLMTGTEARGVIVDALDERTYVETVIDPYSDYLPFDYTDPGR